MISVLAAMAGTAYAQLKPPAVNPVVSDGAGNTAMGTGALNSNGTPSLTYPLSAAYNTASGSGALHSNMTGFWNTATGYQALYSNVEGYANTASGVSALASNTTGNYNTASGASALGLNTTGSNNTAYGAGALGTNGSNDGLQTGNDNTASGVNALSSNTTGNNNTALGYQSGYNLSTGSNNIDIGNPGGSSAENRTIRIGSLGVHTTTYIAGITDSHIRGRPVVISEEGRLGVEGSSERYKIDITTMDSSTANLQQLRPVTFRLKDNPKGPVQYGLIAEEVAKVYPELVIRDGDGKIDGVRYEELAPMLLNEVQQLHQKLVAQAQQLQDVQEQLAEVRELKQQLAELKELNQAAKSSQVNLEAKEGHPDRL